MYIIHIKTLIHIAHTHPHAHANTLSFSSKQKEIGSPTTTKIKKKQTNFFIALMLLIAYVIWTSSTSSFKVCLCACVHVQLIPLIKYWTTFYVIRSAVYLYTYLKASIPERKNNIELIKWLKAKASIKVPIDSSAFVRYKTLNINTNKSLPLTRVTAFILFYF